MNADEWLPTAFLAYHPTSGMLQQKWTRKCYEYRNYGGVSRRTEWYEHNWRDVPTRLAEAEPRATEPQPGDSNA
jgi:hypothetical protein